MISLFGIFESTMGQLVKVKHVVQELPSQQIFQLRADLSVLNGFGSCGCCTWQLHVQSAHVACLAELPLCASAIAVVDQALYRTLKAATNSCNKLEI